MRVLLPRVALSALAFAAVSARSGNQDFYSIPQLKRAGINITEYDALQAAIKATEQTTGVFQKIYQKGVWGSFNGAGGGSGYGSLPTVAAGASRIIYHVVLTLGARRIIDAPCGSMAWQASLVAQLRRQISGFSFLGIDIVPEVIARNIRVHGRGQHVNFAIGDISDEAFQFPSGYDLIYCRDALMHLPNRLVRQALRNLACSSASHVLIGSDDVGRQNSLLNKDIHTGEWRHLSLTQPPFKLKPEHVYIEDVDDRPRLSLHLFKVQSLRRQLNARCAGGADAA